MTPIQAFGCSRFPGDFDCCSQVLPVEDDSSAEGRRQSFLQGMEPSVMLVQQRVIELRAMAGMLSVLGYRVTAAVDTGKALLWFGRQPSDLFISDLDMPQLNGFQLAWYIRRHSPQTRIILMTACCQAEVVEYMDNRVVDGWLFKPFGISALGDILKDRQEAEWRT